MSRPPSSPSQPLERILPILWIILALGLWQSGSALVQGAVYAMRPYETSYPEAFVLFGAESVTQGRPLYPRPGGYPYAVMVYNPLAYLPAGLAGRLFHLDLPGIRMAGRAISFASLIGLAALLAAWAIRRTGDWRRAALAASGLLYFSWPTMSDFFRLRPEIPGLLCGWCGLALAASGGRLRLAASAACFFLAFLFKQSFIAGPLAVFLWLLMNLRWRDGALFGGILGMAVTVFYWAMIQITHGAFLAHTVVAMAVNEVHPLDGFKGAVNSLGMNVFGLAASALLVVISSLLRRSRDLIPIYLVLASAWAFLSGGKLGASLNYWAEPLTAALFLVSSSDWRCRPKRHLTEALVLLPLCAQVCYFLARPKPFGEPGWTPGDPLAKYAERYANVRGPMLITDELLAIRLGRVAALDWLLLDDLSAKGRMDTSSLFAQVAHGDFETILSVDQPSAPLEARLLDAIGAGPYRPGFRDDYLTEWNRTPGLDSHGGARWPTSRESRAE